ncbi:DNA topoisomerase I [bacterium Unc6]|nr:DNA topoisomerase I [bacterium Unc6]
MLSNLVIVESPAKAKTIGKFLGTNYTVKASMGHVIDLPGNRMGIEISNEKIGEPEYVVIKGKKTVLTELKKIAKNSNVYIATDPDREGEAIGWHILNYIKAENPRRILLYEITKEAVQYAIEHPSLIDNNKVQSQQARRILDRVVGYSISPILWKKVGRGLSAGRVQSVAVRIIVERDRQIRAFVSEEYWTIDAIFSKLNNEVFTSRLDRIQDEKINIKTKQQADGIIARIKGCKKFSVSDIKITEKKKNPSPPFITSQLQQVAFNKFHFPAIKTIKIAQTLYEGLQIGSKEQAGLITYIRTDSVRCSESAIKDVRKFIGEKYGDGLCPESPNRYKSKKTAQEAHEAIRPTSVYRTPDDIKQNLTEEQFKIYELIWQKFVASQMSPAIFSQIRIEITGINNQDKFLFVSTGSVPVFLGFLSVYQEADKRGLEEKSEGEIKIPSFTKNEQVELKELKSGQHFTQPPPHYTDASLIKALEEKGIGRPSTYAGILQVIVNRGYVKREKGALLATEIGEIVTDMLIKSFPNILDVKFTAQIEDELDIIEQGKTKWDAVILNFYRPFKISLDNAGRDMQNFKKIEVKTDKKCEKCQSPMVIKWGRNGRFIACSAYPSCKNTKSIGTGVKCPSQDCGGELVERRARKKGARLFYGCSRYPECKFVTSYLKKI